MRGGKRPGAGRPKGSIDMRTKLMNEAMAAASAEINDPDLSPKDFLLILMRHPGVHPAVRMEAARAVLPYCNPKLENIAHTGEGNTGPVQHSVSHIIEAAVMPTGEAKAEALPAPDPTPTGGEP